MAQSVAVKISKQKDTDWRRLSDPAIYRTLHLAAIVGCFLGLLLFARHEAQRIAQLDAVETSVWAETLAPGVELKLEQGNLLARKMVPLVEDALGDDLTAQQRRNAKVHIDEEILRSSASGIAVIRQGGSVLGVFGELPTHGYIWPESEMSPGTNVELLRFTSGGQKYFAYLPNISVVGNAQLVIVYRADTFTNILDQAITPSILFNRDGELLTASGGVEKYAFGPDVDLLLDVIALSRSVTERDKKLSALQKLFAESGALHTDTTLIGGAAHIVTFRREKGPLATLWKFRGSLMLLLGPAILAVLLVLSLIQNEWRRQDKMDQDSGNMAARARIAGEIMSAGIIDWSINEGAVSYSEGWAHMFGYATPPQYEEVFDWIERIHPDDKLRIRSAYEDLQNGTVVDLAHTIRVRAVSGEYTRVHERGRVHIDAAGIDRHVILVQMPA